MSGYQVPDFTPTRRTRPSDAEVIQPASVVEIRIPASAYAELTEDERMFTVDGDRYIVTAGPQRGQDDTHQPER